MRPRFQADADLNHRIVIGLRRREPSINFRTAREGRVTDIPDPEVLEIAAGEDRILVTHDRKTMPGHLREFVRKRSSPGLIVVSQDLDIGSAIEELLLIWAVTDAEEWRNIVGFVPI